MAHKHKKSRKLVSRKKVKRIKVALNGYRLPHGYAIVKRKAKRRRKRKGLFG